MKKSKQPKDAHERLAELEATEKRAKEEAGVLRFKIGNENARAPMAEVGSLVRLHPAFARLAERADLVWSFAGLASDDAWQTVAVLRPERRASDGAYLRVVSLDRFLIEFVPADPARKRRRKP